MTSLHEESVQEPYPDDQIVDTSNDNEDFTPPENAAAEFDSGNHKEVEDENSTEEVDASRLSRTDVLEFNQSLSRARYSRINLDLLQRVEPITNTLTNEEVADVIVASLGNALKLPINTDASRFSYSEKYANVLCEYNMGEINNVNSRFMFKPRFFDSIGGYKPDAGDDRFQEFKKLLARTTDRAEIVENVHIMARPHEIMEPDLISKTKKMLAYDILLEDGVERRRIKEELQSSMIEYEKKLLSLYERLQAIRNNKKTDLSALKQELSIGYLLLALSEEGYEDVFINKTAQTGLYIESERIRSLKRKAETGISGYSPKTVESIDYVPLEVNFKPTTVDVDNLFAKMSASDLDEVIDELSALVQEEEYQEEIDQSLFGGFPEETGGIGE